MADVKVGNFAINTSTGNQSVTGIGFKPKLIIFFPTNRTAAGIGGDAFMNFGAVSSPTERFAICGNSEDGVATTDTNKGFVSDKCILKYDIGTVVVDYDADLVSFNADGFTINVTTAPGSAFDIGYMAFGGDDFHGKVGTFQASTSADVEISSLGFSPTGLIFAATGGTTGVTAGGNMAVGIGFASSVTQKGTFSVASSTGLGTSDTYKAFDTTRVMDVINVGGTERIAFDIKSFDTDGFTVEQGTSGNQFPCFYIALGGMLVHVDIFQTQTSTGTFSNTDPGFLPNAGIFGSTLTDTDQLASQSEANISLGAYANGSWVSGMTDEDAQGTSDTDHFFATNRIYKQYNFARSLLGDISFSSWDANGFTLDQTDADPSTKKVLYMVFGPALIDLPLLESDWTPFAVEDAVTDLSLLISKWTPFTPIIIVSPTPIPNQRPSISSPGEPQYKIRLKNQSGTLVAEFDTWKALSFIHLENHRGSTRLEIDGSDNRKELFELDGQIEILRQNPVLNLPWYTEWEGFYRTRNEPTYVNDNSSFVAFGFTYLDLIHRAYIMYAAGSSGAVKSGLGEAVVKSFVSENVGIEALISNGRDANNVMPGLTIEPDNGNGTTWSGSKPRKPLIDVLKEIALTTGIDYDVVGTGPGTFEFRTYANQRGTDRTKGNADGNAPIVFSLGYGNMSIPMLSKNRGSEITAAYALGRGNESDRQVQLEESLAKLDSPWNRIESVINSSGSTNETELTSAAKERLQEGTSQDILSFDPIQTLSYYYGKHYKFGDKVTAFYKGLEIDKKLVRVSVNVSANARGEDLALEFADNME